MNSLDSAVECSISGSEGKFFEARDGRHGVRDRIEVVVLQREVLQRFQVRERLLVDVLYAAIVQVELDQLRHQRERVRSARDVAEQARVRRPQLGEYVVVQLEDGQRLVEVLQGVPGDRREDVRPELDVHDGVAQAGERRARVRLVKVAREELVVVEYVEPLQILNRQEGICK